VEISVLWRHDRETTPKNPTENPNLRESYIFFSSIKEINEK